MCRFGLSNLAWGAFAAIYFLGATASAQDPKAAPMPKVAPAPKAAPAAPVAVAKSDPPAEAKSDFITLPVNAALRANPQKVAEVKQTVHKVLQGSLPLGEYQQQFEGYFTLYLFPMMTQLENMGQLPKARETLFKDFLRRQESPEAHDRLIKLTLEQMGKIAKGNYHPAARVNAMLIIGELNSTEANAAQRITQQPMLEALNFMLDELVSPNQIDAVRVAALVGILRHAEVDRTQPAGGRRMPATASGAVVTRLVPLITAKQPPEKRSAAGHAWMQRRAIEIVGSLGQVDKNEEIPAALDALLLDDTAPDTLRVTAAAALGRIAPASKKLDPGATALKMGALANDIFGSDLEDLREQERKAREREKAQRVAGGAAAGGAGFAPVDPANDPDIALQRRHLEPIRRRMKQLLGEINTGLVGTGKEGILPLVTKEPAKTQAKEIADSVTGLLALMEKANFGRQEFLEVANPLADKIASASKAAEPKKPATTPAKPATPKSEFDDELK